jgi:hypothetical protein
MRKVMLGLALFALGAVGCATSAQIEKEARRHDLRADNAAHIRDYQTASAEKAEAERLHRKAVKKAYKEGVTDTVVVPVSPSEVPHEPPPVVAP